MSYYGYIDQTLYRICNSVYFKHERVHEGVLIYTMENQRILKRVSNKTRVKLPPIEESNDNRVKTILDIDPDFYSLVDGRPIQPSTSISKYKKNIKDVALKRTLHGFLLDEILRIDRDIKAEKNIYEISLQHFNECQESFNKFLADDNNKTIVVMKKSDTLAKELAGQMEEHKKANYEYASLKSKLQYIDETLQILLSFQNFLYNAAPILWQDDHRAQLIKSNFEIFTMDSDMFRGIDVKLLKERLEKLPLPQLYFKTPEQILNIFQLLEKQNLNYLLKTEELRCEKNKFMKSLELLKRLLQLELDYIKDAIHEVEKSIARNDEKEKELKQEFFRILEGKIKFLISSEMILHISNDVEFAYEQVIGPNETKLSPIEQVLALEQEYNGIMLDLSAFDLNTIKYIEKSTYENEAKQMKQAKEAAKLLKDVDKLSKRLNSSFNLNRKL